MEKNYVPDWLYSSVSIIGIHYCISRIPVLNGIHMDGYARVCASFYDDFKEQNIACCCRVCPVCSDDPCDVVLDPALVFEPFGCYSAAENHARSQEHVVDCYRQFCCDRPVWQQHSVTPG